MNDAEERANFFRIQSGLSIKGRIRRRSFIRDTVRRPSVIGQQNVKKHTSTRDLLSQT